MADHRRSGIRRVPSQDSWTAQCRFARQLGLDAVWRWLSDGTVYLLLFISGSGLYLWFAIKAERRIGLGLIAAGALSFSTLLYGLTF
jgi:hypothetical protein